MGDLKQFLRIAIAASALSFGCSASSDDSASAEQNVNQAIAVSKKPLLQVGPWVAAPFNIEEPYANIIHASETRWSCGDLETAELYEGGYISRKTGLPLAKPSGCTLKTSVFFSVPHNSGLMPHWDGDWVVDCESDGRVELNLLYFPADNIKRRKPCRIEFTRDAENNVTPYHMAVEVKRLDAPMTALRMYRKENEAAVNSGKIYNPRFIAAVAEYDVIRTMDLQEANRSGIRSVSDLAGPDAAHWGNLSWQSGKNLKQPFRSMPISAVFALGVEADTALWVHAPIMLGSTIDIYDEAIYDADIGKWLKNISSAVTSEAKTAIASDEWDKYADAFVGALVASGYPTDRTLYVTVSNEVWNFAGQYNLTSRYAGALGEGLSAEIGGGDFRTGYGAAMARWKLALDAALSRAGRDQALIYVVEGQAAAAGTSDEALRAAKAWIEGQGEEWEAHSHSFGLSVASYWGSSHYSKAGVDPNDLAALEKWQLEGPPQHVATLAWILAQFRAHADVGRRYGVPLIGAYEGGSHFDRPDQMDRQKYREYVWGEYGGRINELVNEAIAEAFPGVILSNYVLAGPQGGQPWFEGPLGDKNPYNDSWRAYLRP
jgi:hypothetical protein